MIGTIVLLVLLVIFLTQISQCEEKDPEETECVEAGKVWIYAKKGEGDKFDTLECWDKSKLIECQRNLANVLPQ